MNIYKTTLLALMYISCISYPLYPQEKIKDFYLSNLNEQGSCDWEVKGDEALISNEHVDIKEMDAKYYTEKDTIKVTSKKAKLNKENMDVHLQDDVQIENAEGMTLITDSLDWKQKNNSIATEDPVEINNDSMYIKAKGMQADTALKNVDFKEDIEVRVPDKENKDFTTITCKGPLEIEYSTGTAVFYKDVIVENEQATLFSDKTTMFFDTQLKKIIKIVSEGNVKIVKDENVTFSEKATYWNEQERIVLEGRPRLIYFSKKGEKAGRP
ncbi:MAG: LPS export ABC transporter periplasmic protein LptC [Candidatus Omnitrophota bacterium]